MTEQQQNNEPTKKRGASELEKLLGIGNKQTVDKVRRGELPEDVLKCDAEFGGDGPHQIKLQTESDDNQEDR